jgi:beta-glucanase (GH16 family)
MSKQTTARRSRVAYAVAVAALIVGATAFVGLRDAETNTASAAAATFTEEFNGPAGSGVDGSRWKHEIGNGANGWGNHERQYYTDGTKNAVLDGQGNLVITAKRENPAGYDCWFGKCEYTSAKFSTAQTFSQTYGRFETRMKLPRGQGIWPAFWMLGTDIGSVGWPNSGELDIMENVGKEPGTVYGTLHGPGYSGAEGVTGRYTLPNGQAFADAFHTFAVDWSPNRISWSVDGNVYQTRTPADLGGDRWVFDKPFYMILNLAVGGDWPGSPDGSTQFPQQLVVDYVRVTDTSGGGGATGPTGQISGIGGKCVDVNAASTANGTAVQLY